MWKNNSDAPLFLYFRALEVKQKKHANIKEGTSNSLIPSKYYIFHTTDRAPAMGACDPSNIIVQTDHTGSGLLSCCNIRPDRKEYFRSISDSYHYGYSFQLMDDN